LVGKKLPDGWKLVKFKKVAEIDNRTISPDEMKGKFQNYIGLENIESNTGQLVNFSETLGDDIKSNKFQFTEEHILYGKLRPYLNKVYLPDFAGVCSTDIIPIKPDSDLLIREFLGYFLRTPEFVSTINTKATGANLPRVSPNALLDVYIPLPPLDTQRKIVAILDKAEATQRLRAEADALTQELQRSAFLEIFGNPVKNEKGWVKKPLREFGEIITGNTPPRERAEYYGNHIEWIKSDNINTPFTYLTRSEEMLSKQGADVGRIAPKGSVLITCIAGSISCIGNTAIADREVAFNQQINAIVPNKSVNPVFLYHLFRNSQGYIQKFSTHSMKGMISKGVLSSIPLILPPVEIQDSFASIAQQIEEIRNQQHESTYEVSSLLNALMSKAFIGELISN